MKTIYKLFTVWVTVIGVWSVLIGLALLGSLGMDTTEWYVRSYFADPEQSEDTVFMVSSFIFLILMSFIAAIAIFLLGYAAKVSARSQSDKLAQDDSDSGITMKVGAKREY